MTMGARRRLCGVVVLVLAGCGQGGTTVPVQGKVLVDGKPLTVGTVIFKPDAVRGNTSQHEPHGKLDANGVYQVYQAKGSAGASPGWYKIGIVAQRLKNPKDRYSHEYMIPKKFANPETSGLALQVVEQPAPGAYDIALPTK